MLKYINVLNISMKYQAREYSSIKFEILIAIFYYFEAFFFRYFPVARLDTVKENKLTYVILIRSISRKG